MTEQVTANDIRRMVDDYLKNTSVEELRKELDNRNHLYSISPPLNPGKLDKPSKYQF